MLDSAGPQAGQIERLWWMMFWVCTVVFVVVVALLCIAMARGHDGADKEDAAPEKKRRLARTVGAGVAVTAVILIVFLVASIQTGDAIHGIESPGARTISITGQQWWWEARYEDPAPSDIVTTANEIHIPVGEPVHLKLRSKDVIHSFWVPNLHGKKDLIPGEESSLWLQADRAGVFEGQCAEFCGMQHAHMRFLVIAQAPEEFQAWLEQQRLPAREPATPSAERGREVFLSSTCIMCHTIRGTPAGGKVAPDLTHLAGRRTLAAAAVPNTRGYLAGWILDPQRIKPGNHMPPNGIASEDLQALLDYLTSLE